MVARLIVLIAVLASVAAGCGSDEDTGTPGGVAESVTEQLRYLDPQSSSVVAVDLRWEGDNWDDVKPLVERLLKAYREKQPLPERKALPETAEDGIEQLAGFANLSFADDVKPALDGHLVVGAVVPPNSGADLDEGYFDAEQQAPEPVLTAVYRTEKGDLRKLFERAVQEEPLKPVPGHPDAAAASGGLVLVGNKTAIFTSGDLEDGPRAWKAALDRAKDGAGFPAARLAEAEQDTGMSDPLVLATGDLTVARELVEEANLERAREAIPYLRALRRGSVALDVTGDAIRTKAKLVTDREPLEERDLPVGPAGELELPDEKELIAGGSRNQSYTTTFMSRLARALFADSRFVEAVEKAEKDIGANFEDEVLRQFDCPSVSVLDPPPADAADAAPRFGARSCVADPDRMRELLPKLRPHLPAILTGLQGLGDEGLTALLLLAPDAPLVPGGPIAQIRVTPADEGAAGETLYEIDGLRSDEQSDAAQAGPDAIVFGLIGDAFVVASDFEMARRAARLETGKIDRDAGAALRVPVRELLLREGDDDTAAVAAEVFGELLATVSADPKATSAEATLEIRD
jgi:hypothetical protein